MPTSIQQPEDAGRAPLLRRAEQAAAAMVIAASLVVSCAYWLVHAPWTERRPVEIDRAAPLHAQFQVDINTAAWPELSQLPGIGETLARRIVESRETDGPYLDHSDLRRVRGIGPRTMERLRPYLLPLPPASDVAGRR